MDNATFNGITLAAFLIFCAAAFFFLGNIFKSLKDPANGDNIFHISGFWLFMFGVLLGVYCLPI